MLKPLRIKNHQDKYLYLICLGLVLVGLISRLLWLDRLPPAISHDEVDLVLSSQTAWLYRTDASGTPYPQALLMSQLESGTTGLPSLLLAPVLGPLKLNLLNIRLVWTVINLLTALLITKLVYLLTENEKLTLISLTVFLLNPWSFLYARAALAAPLTLLLLLVAVYLLFSNKGKRVYRALPFFLLGLFAYYGAWPIVPPLLLGLLYLHGKQQSKKQLKVNFTFFVVIMLALVSFWLISRSMPASTLGKRTQEISFFNLAKVTEQVNESRRQSISHPFNMIFANKGSFLLTELGRKYLGAFSINFLFTSGDPTAVADFKDHGVFYLIDALFLVLGIMALFKYRKQAITWLASLFILIGPLGSSLSVTSDSYLYRAFPLLFGLTLLIALGFWLAYENLGKKKRKLVLSLFAILYLTSFIHFLSFFFFHYPVEQAENHFLSERILANYLSREKDEVLVITPKPEYAFKQYAFYTNQFKAFENIPLDHEYRIGKVTFSSACPEETVTKTTVISTSVDCPKENESALIQDQKDAGTLYRIYNHQICQEVSLDPWRRAHLLSDYGIEQMKAEDFCQRWLAIP